MKNYVKPEMNFEEFSSNSYVAACGQTVDGDYLFACDHPGGDVYLETNGTAGRQRGGWNPDQHLGSVHACDKTHKTSDINDFVDGYVDGVPAIILLDFTGTNKNYGTYKGKIIRNYHASQSLTREQLTVVKS